MGVLNARFCSILDVSHVLSIQWTSSGTSAVPVHLLTLAPMASSVSDAVLWQVCSCDNPKVPNNLVTCQVYCLPTRFVFTFSLFSALFTASFSVYITRTVPTHNAAPVLFILSAVPVCIRLSIGIDSVTSCRQTDWAGEAGLFVPATLRPDPSFKADMKRRVIKVCACSKSHSSTLFYFTVSWRLSHTVYWTKLCVVPTSLLYG